jgi:hypothetical protein
LRWTGMDDALLSTRTATASSCLNFPDAHPD